MSTYDSVIVRCPNCSTEVEFQSKAGDCNLAKYNLANCPRAIALDLGSTSRDCPVCCDSITFHYDKPKAYITNYGDD